MAITTIGAPLSGLRGTIGGITFSANKAGPYAKIWTPSTNPNTPPQATQRSQFVRSPSLWRGMSDQLRADWETFAALPAQELTNSLGEAYYATGFNWLTKCNARVLRHGGATFTAVPTQARPGAPTITELRITPTGTESDQCVCGTATASTERPGFPAAWAFDDNLSTPWSTSIGNTTGWIRYEFCDPVNIKRYRLYPNIDLYTRAPRDWLFRVWAAGAWETIHTVTLEDWTETRWYDFACANPYTEILYMLEISANQGDPNYINIGEIEMYLADVGYSCVIFPEDQFENSPSYAIVIFVAMTPSQGRAVQYPGYYLIAADITPGRHHQEFQADLEAVFGTILKKRKWFGRIHMQTAEGIRGPSTNKNTLTLE